LVSSILASMISANKSANLRHSTAHQRLPETRDQKCFTFRKGRTWRPASEDNESEIAIFIQRFQ
jgi:hypothetical protein